MYFCKQNICEKKVLTCYVEEIDDRLALVIYNIFAVVVN